MAHEEQENTEQVPENFSPQELGSTCKSVFGDTVDDFDEFIDELKGLERYETIQEMVMNDPLIGGTMFTIENLFRQVPWKVKGGSDEANELVTTSLFEDMEFTFGETISSILSFLPYGFFTPEMVFKRREKPQSKFSDGRLGFDKFAPRPQESIDFKFKENSNEIRGVKQRLSCFDSKFIPRWKILHFRTQIRRNNNPKGRSIFRHAFRPWQIKKRIENLEAIGVERDLAGIPIAWLPPEIINGTTEEHRKARDKYRDLVVNIRRDEQEGILFPMEFDESGNKKYDLTLLGSDGNASRQLDTSKIITRWDIRIVQAILMDFIMLGAAKRGSFSLSKSKIRMFKQAHGGFLDIIADVFNRKAIPTLLEVNGMDTKDAPRLTHGDIDPPTMQEISNILQSVGMASEEPVIDQEVNEEILERIGLNEDDNNQLSMFN